MKKLLFMFATAALVLSACSSEDDLAQGGATQAQLGAAAGALDFDVYTASATKAGDPVGVMNTEKLKTLNKGFGVFSMYQDGYDYPANNTTYAPNFMFNEHVSWTAAGGWAYSPLKYWPNETIQDSQSPNATTPGSAAGDPVVYTCDKLSFFAYAPYVSTGTSNTLDTKADDYMVATYSAPGVPATYYDKAWKGTETSGILSMSAENRVGDPLVEWKYSTDLDQNVDLLWGVAPNGMAYQSVNPDIYINKTFGLPLLDLVKPDKDQKIKFLFNHALSRIGLSVVSAVDQIAAGDDGGKFNNLQTRVLVKSVEVYGAFGKKGVLNLNNTTANVANWIGASIDQADANDLLFTFDSRQNGSTGNGYIAPDLRYVDSQINGVTGAADAAAAATAFSALNTGVLPSEQTLLSGDADPSKKVTNPAFEYGKVYYKALTAPDKGYAIATTSATNAVDAYELTGTYDAADSKFTRVFKTEGGSKATVSGNTPQLYALTFSAEKTASATPIANGDVYYTKEGEEYTYHKATAAISDDTKYFTLETKNDLAVDAYAAGDYYTGLIPRYFMVIPTGDTNIKVKITYAVVTYDEKLGGYITNVNNAITKATTINLENGKSYTLKLILGLTSVKLDATVADWQVDGSNEVYLPQNNE